MVMATDDGYSYEVETMADPGALSRILELFALNNFVPETVSAYRTCDALMRVELSVCDVDYMRARVISSKLAQIITVRSVRLFQLNRRAVVGDHGGVVERTEVLA